MAIANLKRNVGQASRAGQVSQADKNLKVTKPSVSERGSSLATYGTATLRGRVIKY